MTRDLQAAGEGGRTFPRKRPQRCGAAWRQSTARRGTFPLKRRCGHGPAVRLRRLVKKPNIQPQ
ncbi:MAG: hypothetical protein O9972_27150 [Burkholderiales bacterium]|nr:hypothetical protein [Burkholderiales bacterium]